MNKYYETMLKKAIKSNILCYDEDNKYHISHTLLDHMYSTYRREISKNECQCLKICYDSEFAVRYNYETCKPYIDETKLVYVEGLSAYYNTNGCNFYYNKYNTDFYRYSSLIMCIYSDYGSIVGEICA
jgi:hypothetical protein